MNKDQNEKGPIASSGDDYNPKVSEVGSEGAGKKKVKEKKTPSNIVIPPKKPKLSKAERRALQEAQRAAKGQRVDGGDGEKKMKPANDEEAVAGGGHKVAAESKNLDRKASGVTTSTTGTGNSNSARAILKQGKATSQVKEEDDKEKTLNFFSHLPLYKGTIHFSFIQTC